MNIIPEVKSIGSWYVLVSPYRAHGSHMVSWVRELFSFRGWESEQCSNHSLRGSPALGNLLISPLSHVIVQFASSDARFFRLFLDLLHRTMH